MISIVTPTYNRGGYLEKNRTLIDQAMKNAGFKYEWIVVDDGSSDDTAKKLKKLAYTYPQVKGLVLEKNVGQQNATLAGIRRAGYEYIVTLDDDLSFDPESIVELFNGLKQGYDVVYGVPIENHDFLHRNLGTAFKEIMFFLFLRKPYGKRLTSFRIMNKSTCEFVCGDKNERIYISARLLKKTKNIGNIQVGQLTKGEKSHYTIWKLIRLMLNVILHYTKTGRIILRLTQTGKKTAGNDNQQYSIKDIYL